MATTENTYESQFTKENILSLKSHISREINNYAKEEVEGGKLDIFLILAALGQCAYEVVINTLPKDDADARKNVDEMKVLVDKFIIETDKTGQELQLQPAPKLLAAAHLISLMSEYYSRRRDEVVLKLIQESAQEGKQPGEVIELQQLKQD